MLTIIILIKDDTISDLMYHIMRNDKEWPPPETKPVNNRVTYPSTASCLISESKGRLVKLTASSSLSRPQNDPDDEQTSGSVAPTDPSSPSGQQNAVIVSNSENTDGSVMPATSSSQPGQQNTANFENTQTAGSVTPATTSSQPGQQNAANFESTQTAGSVTPAEFISQPGPHRAAHKHDLTYHLMKKSMKDAKLSNRKYRKAKEVLRTTCEECIAKKMK